MAADALYTCACAIFVRTKRHGVRRAPAHCAFAPDPVYCRMESKRDAALLLVIACVATTALVAAAAVSVVYANRNKGHLPADQSSASITNGTGIVVTLDIRHTDGATEATKEGRERACHFAVSILANSLQATHARHAVRGRIVFDRLEEGVIGSTVPYVCVVAERGQPRVTTVAQARMLVRDATVCGGTNVSEPDWITTINVGGNIPWSYAAPGPHEHPAAVNMATVVAHECCHGLGLYTQAVESGSAVRLDGGIPSYFDAAVHRVDRPVVTLATTPSDTRTVTGIVEACPDNAAVFTDRGNATRASGATKTRLHEDVEDASRIHVIPDVPVRRGQACTCNLAHGGGVCGPQDLSSPSRSRMSAQGTGTISVFTPCAFVPGSSVAHLPEGSPFTHCALTHQYSGVLLHFRLSDSDLRLMAGAGWNQQTYDT